MDDREKTSADPATQVWLDYLAGEITTAEAERRMAALPKEPWQLALEHDRQLG